MISDNETNKVYFSNQSTYDFKPELKELMAILDEYGIEYGFINGTRDYFCRDYMPIQIDEDTVVRFKFRPDYLLNNPLQRKNVTNTSLVYRRNDLLKNFRTIESDIILDGGNVVKCKSKVIITGKVLTDNPQLDKITSAETRRGMSPQTAGLPDAFPGVEIIIIPRYPNEPTGHADGLVRFVDEERVMTINLDYEIQPWKDDFKKALSDAGLKIISLPTLPDYSEDDWAYINFLQVKNLIIIPALDKTKDPIIEEFFKRTFPDYKIRMVKANRILAQGGGLNCFSWTMKKANG